MNSWTWPFRRRLLISGEVLFIRLTVDMEHGPETNEFLWRVVEQGSSKLRERMGATIHEHLGSEFDVRSMSFARGSVEILLIVGTLYYTVSRYKNFVESIELLLAQLRRTVSDFFDQRGPGPVSVTGNWTPGPGLVQSAAATSALGVSTSLSAVVWYMIVSHAAMLTAILWLLLNAFRRATP